MDKNLEIKLKGMLWDLPAGSREKILRHIISDPLTAFSDEQLLIRALNSLSWYDLIGLLGHEKLFQLLNEHTINKLYPPPRRIFFKNAKRLLSKYTISASG
jgi:hypothetical protein